MKICPRCKLEKDDSCFHLRNGKLWCWCIDCCKEYDREYRKKPRIKEKFSRCSICTIRIGNRYENKTPMYLNGKKVCGWCYEDYK